MSSVALLFFVSRKFCKVTDNFSFHQNFFKLFLFYLFDLYRKALLFKSECKVTAFFDILQIFQQLFSHKF